ncbi:isocitrate lyase/phosphoenolpyruvate mutase family protein [Pseudoalteromonas sp. APAL1]|jgi:2-methylisocitrate lyase-like PEP mutase family enzyme|uniref:isocitrate lyase/PEP mutase family protein n=1 Tax=Pseudoalteromonas TaxID=53246 RepID=UPI0018F68284|nr:MULTISPECIES: isocitrate lyase/phosphoenolpyruvate mutase family protein [unclassified Pseudoalteromonas]MCF2922240.1 isocitrate lyase/phosphoenolpyruvate mutase family protein [Pseudoalteromonas sp. APAL1]|tara:strand:+ start:1786 stop:2526 length:741 start_codon:yes stop_codon:yes gene_type:complete
MDKYQLFHQLHHQPTGFVLANAWDLSSAQFIQAAGAKALATTSWGIAASLGLADGENISFQTQLALVKSLTKHIHIPLTVDIESGYSNDPLKISQNVLALARLGVVGINIEDSNKDTNALRSIEQQCTIISEIKKVLNENGFGSLFINARTDTFFVSDRPFQATLERAKAYQNAGADGLFVPGLTNIEQITSLTNAIDMPLNVMAMSNFNSAKAAFAGGAKRFSLGNSLYDLVGNTIKSTLIQLES